MKPKAESTTNLYMNAIISFYKAHRIELPEITLPSGDIGLAQNFGRQIKNRRNN